MSIVSTDKDITSRIVSNIRSNAPAHLSTGKRLEALEVLAAGLPSTKHEEFKHTPLTRELEKNFSFAGGVSTIGEVNPGQFLINGLEANVLVFINGMFSEKNSRIISAEIRIESLSKAVTENRIAQEHFGKYLNHTADAYVGWNTAAWSQGVFIHVPESTTVELPVVFLHIHEGENEVTAINRNLLVVGKNSDVTIIEKFESHGNGKHFLNLVNEIFIDENAGVNFYTLQNDAGQRFQFELTQIHQKRSSRVNTFTFTLDGRLMRNNLQLSLDGEGIESHMFGLYLLHNDTIADNHTVVDHKKPNSFSNEFYKGVMDGSSKGIFNGKIYVRPDAQKTNAFQSNRNILLTDKATVNTKPQLEIWADDVKCSHGCTSGQLDEEALFYLQTRGLSKVTARAMMLYAFAAEVLDHVKNPVIKEYLDALISERLHKNF